MKKFLTICTTLLLLSGISYAQTQKFAHIDFEKLIDAMPEKEVALQTLQKEYKEAQNMIEEMSVELNRKYMNAQKSLDTLSALGRQMLEEELMQQQQRIQMYQKNAEQRLSERRESLLNPILQKAQNSVKEVAEKEGFIYVFDTSEGSQILYFSAKSTDILSLVKKHLGITE
ncbi:MAG: OmpH family outer membrane protein [Bacteroidales bacterium]|nr:OmpH family outer membrane protein [Bacteroidales bacterium]